MVSEGVARLSNRPPESTVSNPRRRSRPLVRSRPLTRSSLHSPSHIHLRHSRAGIKMSSASAGWHHQPRPGRFRLLSLIVQQEEVQSG
ncbi:hypothetical protein UPYG_G00128150 [Umbra pygmaea]|uniref:Uncharacterized protein n=1 Tax=Umbra pygmaea TaxID=75934 RepID=A0ABD0XRK5_UMBPY